MKCSNFSQNATELHNLVDVDQPVRDFVAKTANATKRTEQSKLTAGDFFTSFRKFTRLALFLITTEVFFCYLDFGKKLHIVASLRNVMNLVVSCLITPLLSLRRSNELGMQTPYIQSSNGR
jgi:hypothetical protein